jgi:D-arabinose 1-dehydrogenase-like Zn-dependent alcohol dehydrogenase
MVASEPSMSELLQQARDGVIRPSIETTSLSAVPEIIDKMSRREISGRIVVSLP